MKGLIQALMDRRISVITAESCTCGRLPDALCVPGASDVLLGGYITYTNARKCHDLGVSTNTIAAHTEVSAQCAREMALGALGQARKTRGSGDIVALSTTGFVGPYREELPTKDWHAFIGLAMSWSDRVEVQEVNFTVDARDPNRDLVVDTALCMLRAELEGYEK